MPKSINKSIKILKHIKLKPVAFDSFSVRSMATYVETDQRIFVDPGIAIAPVRYGLEPSQQELNALEQGEKRIIAIAKQCDILSISHYHYDHYMPDTCIYKNKIVLVKDGQANINKSQHERAIAFFDFLKQCKPAKLLIADNKQFVFGKTKLVFSMPAWHGGENSKLGFVLMLAIHYKNECVVHASDVQGPQWNKAADWIIKQNPDVLIISGFPTLFLGWRFGKKALSKANANLIRILKQSKVKVILLDHHIVRDLHYKQKIAEVLQAAQQQDKQVLTAAEFAGIKPLFLEARRKELSS